MYFSKSAVHAQGIYSWIIFIGSESVVLMTYDLDLTTIDMTLDKDNEEGSYRC